KIAIAETERLRKVLMQWFDRVELCRTPTGFEMMPVPLGSANPRTIRVDYGQWRLSMAAAGYQRRLRIGWTAEQIISAFHTWVEQHGEAPLSTDWRRATTTHPMSADVFRTFGSWRAGLAAAGCTRPRRRRAPPPRGRDRRGRFVAKK